MTGFFLPQVAWLANKETMTWEPATSLPQVLIDEFEGGECNQHVTVSTDACYGMVSHTLVVTKHDSKHPPQAKKQRKTNPTSDPG